MTALRVAFVGKGGSGKSVLAGTLARVLARQGRGVLAVDSDPMPGMAFSLGIPPVDAGLPDDLVTESLARDGPRFRLRVPPVEAVEHHAIRAPDGVRFLQFGKLRGAAGPYVRSQHAFRQIVEGLPDDAWDVVGDLPGGTRQPFFGWGAFARVLVVVVEPTMSSLRTACRLARLADPARPLVAVANKLRRPDDLALVEAAVPLPVVEAVPASRDVADADRAGVALIDAAPESAVVAAVASLARRLPAAARSEEVGR